METITELVEGLHDKDNQVAYACLQRLQAISTNTNEVYPHFGAFVELMTSDHSYHRARGLLMIAAQAKWDEDNRIDEVIDEYLRHVEDAKPITARQCIQTLPEIARYKPELVPDIISALRGANLFRYPGTMQPLLQKDIADALERIREAAH